MTPPNAIYLPSWQYHRVCGAVHDGELCVSGGLLVPSRTETAISQHDARQKAGGNGNLLFHDAPHARIGICWRRQPAHPNLCVLSVVRPCVVHRVLHPIRSETHQEVLQ